MAKKKKGGPSKQDKQKQGGAATRQSLARAAKNSTTPLVDVDAQPPVNIRNMTNEQIRAYLASVEAGDRETNLLTKSIPTMVGPGLANEGLPSPLAPTTGHFRFNQGGMSYSVPSGSGSQPVPLSRSPPRGPGNGHMEA